MGFIIEGQVMRVEVIEARPERTDPRSGEIYEAVPRRRNAHIWDGEQIRVCKLEDWQGDELREGDQVAAYVRLVAWARDGGGRGAGQISFRLLRPVDGAVDDAKGLRAAGFSVGQ